jgi:hypothetical protein
MLADLHDRGALLVSGLGGIWQALLLMALVVLARVSGRPARLDTVRPAATSLFITGIFLIALWWWRGEDAHLLIGFYTLLAATTLDLAGATGALRWPGFAIAATILVLSLRQLPGRPFARQDPQLDRTADVLVGLERDPNTLLMGCGWWSNPQLEYTMAGVRHFRDALRLDVAAVQGKKIYLVRSTRFWNWHKDPRADAWAAECDRESVFRSGDYSVSRCSRLPDPGTYCD